MNRCLLFVSCLMTTLLSPIIAEHFAVLLQLFTRLAFAWLALKRAGTLRLQPSALTTTIYYCQLPMRSSPRSRYKAYWFLGKWALNIYYYLSKTSNWLYCWILICYMHATTIWSDFLLLFIPLFSMYTAFVPVVSCTFDVLFSNTANLMCSLLLPYCKRLSSTCCW
jgi:hypothetical protein